MSIHELPLPNTGGPGTATSLEADGGLLLWLELQPDGPVLHLEGALDLAGGAHLARAINDVRATHPGRLVVDATALRFIDLSGRRALLACRAGAEPDTPVELRVGATVERLTRLVDLVGRHAPA